MAGICGYREGLSGSINAGNLLTSCKVYRLASQEGFGSMEQVSKLFGCYLCCSMYCLCVNVYCHRVTTQLQLINIS